MKLLLISDDFPGFTMICATWSLNCFCFDFHISAEQFYDRKKQKELVKTVKNHKSINYAISNDGSSTVCWISIKIRILGRSEHPGVPILFEGHNLPPWLR